MTYCIFSAQTVNLQAIGLCFYAKRTNCKHSVLLVLSGFNSNLSVILLTPKTNAEKKHK